MSGPSLQRTAFASAFLHLLAISASILIVQQTRTVMMPSPYTVNLMGPEEVSPGTGGGVQGEVMQPPAARPGPDRPAASAMQEKKRADDARLTEKRIEEGISELASKKKVERIVKLRSVVSIRAGAPKAGETKPLQGAKIGSGAAAGRSMSYIDRITGEITREFVYPETGDKGLETVIAVRVTMDGTIVVEGIEKNSGNPLFDRAALRAIAKASPVTPPPSEFDMGIRFSP